MIQALLLGLLFAGAFVGAGIMVGLWHLAEMYPRAWWMGPLMFATVTTLIVGAAIVASNVLGHL